MSDINIKLFAEIKDAINDIQTFSKSTSAALAKVVDNGVSGFKGLNGAVVAFNQGLELASKTFRTLNGVFSAGINAAVGQEEAINDLNNALKLSGTYSDKASKDLQEFASQLQATTTLEDDVVLKTAAYGAALGKLSGQQLKDATLAAANLNAALGVDLETAMKMIVKSTNDGGAAFKKYGIEIEKSRDPSQALAKAIEKINEQFGGSAASKVNTYAGAIAQAKNSWGDMLEEVGNFVIKSPFVIKVISIFSDSFKAMGEALSKLDPAPFYRLVSDGIVFAIDGLILLTKAINPVITSFSFVKAAGLAAFDGIATAVATLQAAQATFISKTVKAFTWLFSTLPAQFIPAGWKESLDAFNENLIAYKEATYETTTELATQTVENFNKMGDAFADTIGQEKLDLIQGILKKTQTEITAASSATTKVLKKNEEEVVKKTAETLTERQKLNKMFYDDWKKEITVFKSFEQSSSEERVQNLKSTLSSISTLTSSNNKTLFRIGQAAAIASATIDGISAVQKALASAPPPWNFALAALVGVATAANVSKIASQKPPAFADGGIVPGSSFSGDKVTARLNSGEMILNQEQQKNLFQMVNEGGGQTNIIEAINNLGARIAGIEIVLRSDDIEIARSVNRAVNNGFILAGR